MIDYEKFYKELTFLSEQLDADQVPYLNYARSYIKAIPEALRRAKGYGKTDTEAMEVRMLYILNNLQGAPARWLSSLHVLCEKYVFPKTVISGIIRLQKEADGKGDSDNGWNEVESMFDSWFWKGKSESTH